MPILELQSKTGPVSLSYLDEGQGDPVVLIHGFASSKEVNWLNPGWVKALTGNGYRVVAFDNRGHGQSTKFHEESHYSLDILADDASALIDALSLGDPHIVGYSMGARIAATLLLRRGEQLRRVVLSGNGWSIVEGSGDWTAVREALLTDKPDEITDLRAKAFRTFADQTGSDRQALAACVTSVRQTLPEQELRKIQNDVLVAIGTRDEVAGSGEKLAAILPNGEYLPIPNRDHMRAVGDKVHIQGVLAFLDRDRR